MVGWFKAVQVKITVQIILFSSIEILCFRYGCIFPISYLIMLDHPS